MKQHRGMRPHDVVILLKIISLGKQRWYKKDLAQQLVISGSEISESLNRSKIAGLVNASKSKVNTLVFLDFLEKGLPYVYPEIPGGIIRGVPTAYSAPPLNEHINEDIPLVWPDPEGRVRGQLVMPLHKNVSKAALNDQNLYELLSLTDALRIGKSRESKVAIDLLKERIFK